MKTTAEKIQTNEIAQSAFRTQCKETFENTPKHKSNLSRPKFHYSMPACVNQIQKHIQVGTKVSLIMQVEVHLSNSPVQELSAPQNTAILHKCQNQLCIMYINHFYVVKVPLGIKYLQVCITDFLFIKYTSHSFSSAMFDCTGFLSSYIQVIHFLVHSILVSKMQVTNFLVHCLTKTNSPILLSVLFTCCLKKKKNCKQIELSDA